MEDIRFLIGNSDILSAVCGEGESARPLPPYADKVCGYLEALSATLRRDKRVRQYPDLVSFGFWCRKANINRQKENCHEIASRIGRGMSFHIAPSNVPVNFAYSMVFGLLAGNSVVVRVPEKDFPQTALLCERIETVLAQEEFETLRNMVCVVKYSKDSGWNAYFSSKCMARVIWGGDSTIQAFSGFAVPPRAIELHFADRYSFAVLSGKAVLEADEESLCSLAHGFYNDTYLMDQNACSSPHLIFWKKDVEASELCRAKELFYGHVRAGVEAYELEDIKSMDKYTLACEYAMDSGNVAEWRSWDNLLYVLRLKELSGDMEQIRGRFGLFYEYDMDTYEEWIPFLTEKTQTCTYYGIDAKELWAALREQGSRGVDRIVPVGKALDIATVWDGYEVIEMLSRRVTVQ